MRLIIASLFIFILVLGSFRIIIYNADRLPAFPTDEVSNLQATVKFFSGGKYESILEGTAYSSGILTTWPGGLGWKLKNNILSARLACGIAGWFSAILLGFLFFRKVGANIKQSISIPIILFAASITSPFAVLYWHGFLLSLGELQGALLLGFALLLMNRFPKISFFLLGCSVWHGKILYSPYALGALGGYFLYIRRVSVKLTFLFSAPLFLWIILHISQFGVDSLFEWFSRQFSWMLVKKVDHSPLLVDSWFSRLWLRFSSPPLEWASYAWVTKIKVLFFVLMPIVLGVFCIFRNWKKSQYRLACWISLGIILGLAVHDSWFFFMHSQMFARHLQPSIYVGIGLTIFWITMLLQESPCIDGAGIARQRYAAQQILDSPYLWTGFMFLIIALQMYAIGLSPLLSPELTYARKCHDLYGPVCNAIPLE